MTLQPCSFSNAHCDIDTHEAGWGNDGKNNVLAQDLEVGDNFVVKAEPGDVEGVDFYIV